MNNYQKFKDFNINRFDNLFGCFSNLCSFSMGLFYSLSVYLGEYMNYPDMVNVSIRRCKIYSIQFIVNLLFSSIFFQRNDTL